MPLTIRKVDGTVSVAVVDPVLLPTAFFVRPNDATAYASGDLVANSTTAAQVRPLVFEGCARAGAVSGMVRRVRFRKTSTSVTTCSFRLHLFTIRPTTWTNGDNGAWINDQVSGYIGALDGTLDRAFSDGAAGEGVPIVGSEINFALGTANNFLYGVIEARSAYTPTAVETITAQLEILAN